MTPVSETVPAPIDRSRTVALMKHVRQKFNRANHGSAESCATPGGQRVSEARTDATNCPDSGLPEMAKIGVMNSQSIRAVWVLAAFGTTALGMATPDALAAQGDAAAATTSVRAVGGAGFTTIHLPAFTYTKGRDRTPVQEPAQEGGGLALTGGLEALRGRLIVGARYQFVVEPLADNWSAHVGAAYAGVARRRSTSTLSAALGATVVHREQVTRAFAPSACFYLGCEDNLRVNRDGGTITTAGALLTVAAERRFGRHIGVGAEGMAASGPQRYVSALVRIAIGLP